VTVVSNPSIATYSNRQMYVVPWEFTNSPTGVDTNNLVPGDATASKQALVVQLMRASGVVDNYCQKVLGATVDVAQGEARVQSHWSLGPRIECPVKNTPVVQLVSASVGDTPASVSPLADLSNTDFSKPGVLGIPIAGGGGPRTFTPSGGGSKFYVLQYVNGWANTTIATAVTTGARSVTVASATGLGPGMALNLQSKSGSEVVVIDASFTPAPTGTNVAVPLTAATVGAYGPGDVATVMPQDIKEATILIAKALIKTRGDAAVVLNAIGGGPGREVPLDDGVASDLDLAEYLLHPYRRAV
jgi:hypothetical protein